MNIDTHATQSIDTKYDPMLFNEFCARFDNVWYRIFMIAEDAGVLNQIHTEDI